MKGYISDAWQKGVSPELYNHLRNKFKGDRLVIFDAITTRSGDDNFFIDYTGIERRRYYRLYNDIANTVLNELIRLADVGLKST